MSEPEAEVNLRKNYKSRKKQIFFLFKAQESNNIANNSAIISVLMSDVDIFPAIQYTDIVHFLISNTNINR